ncbi:MAG: sigma 54-interacting transcriptional regulator [Ignavibacteriota bacterium]
MSDETKGEFSEAPAAGAGVTANSCGGLISTAGSVSHHGGIECVIAGSGSQARDIEEACRIAGDAIAACRQDLRFALFYLMDDDRKLARLAGSIGLAEGPQILHLPDLHTFPYCPLARAIHTNSVQQVDDLRKALPTGRWSESPQRALLVPVALGSQQTPDTLLIAGIGSRPAPHDADSAFPDPMSDLIAATILRVMADSSVAIRQVVDVIPQMIGVLGTDGRVLYVNQTVLEYTGLKPEEVLAPNSRTRYFHPEDIARLAEEHRKGLLGNVPFKLEQRMRRKDGQYRWCLVQYNPLLNEQGRVLRWYGTATDIDDRVAAEERTRNENLALREQIDRDFMFEDIVGSSEALSRVLYQVDKVARSDSTVLILGETGTGKELIARAIHKRSHRAARPFIPVNCAAITPSLIASELFGHEKGAFTGATQRRLGRFESANGGTILLDEVGDLPAEVQIALLRVLQERVIERVGSDRPIAVDVRVLAATHRDLNALVAEGEFRQDLLYRLNVVPIEMPSLRERATDIPLLVEYFIDRFGRKSGKKFRTIDKKTLRMFQSYAWPGNIRELQNVVERAVILSDGDHFIVDETWFQQQLPRTKTATFPLNGALQSCEREMIEAALTESRGRISGPSGAATKLGIPARTLDSKIRRLGIEASRFKVPGGLTARPGA